MLGIFKKFWSKSDTDTVFAPAAPAAKPPVPVTVTTRTGGGAAASRSTTTPRPANPPTRVPVAKPASRPATAHAAPHPSRPGCVNVTLGAIEPSLPEPLRHKIAGALHETVPVPLDDVVPQLQRGSVALTVRQLRSCAPELLASLNGHDDIAVSLPLGEIVPQLDKTCFTRREPMKRWEVPDEVSAIFTPTSDGAAIKINAPAPEAPKVPAAPQPAKAAAKPSAGAPSQAKVPMPAPKAAPSAPSPVAATAPATPAPQAAPLAQAAQATPQPEGKITLSADALASLAAARPSAAPVPANSAAAAVPAAAAPTPAARPAPVAAPAPVIPAPVPAPSFSPAAPAAQQRPTPAANPLPLPLQKLFDFLPQEVRVELADVDVPAATVGVPMQLVESGLKSGRVMFTWNDLSNWLQPPLPRPPSRSAGDLLVELPLKVIAPAFMAHHRAGGAQKKADVGEDIPDLFQTGTGEAADNAAQVRPQAAPAPALAMAQPAAAAQSAAARPQTPAAPTAPQPASQAAPRTAPALPDIVAIVGPQAQRYSPKQILQNVSHLPGVSGALVAMTDGLLVASALPASTKSDTVAAFLPQMFGRMSQYTKELGLGALQSLVLHVEGGCWQVFKQPNIYFAVCGKVGEPMPLNLLTQIAAELSKQTV